MHLLPALGDVKMSRLTPARMRTWYGRMDPEKATSRAHSYLLLHAICTTAVADELLVAQPCRIRGAGMVERKHDTRPATLVELTVIVEGIPPRYELMVLLAAWCGLRFGELTELRRGDVEDGAVYVERGVVRVEGEFVVGDSKTKAGRRKVAVPPHLKAAIDDAIAAIGVVIEKVGVTQQAQGAAAGEADEAMNPAQALGADGVIEAVAAVQGKLEEFAAVLARAGTVSDEVMTAAQAAKT